MSTSDIVGVVLAGGQSRRMGGGDKGLRELAGTPMLAHVIRRLAPQVATVAINANGDPKRFAPFERPVVPDSVTGFAGPLAGVLAGMRWTQTYQPDAHYIATVSADAPFFPLDLVERLRAGLGSGDGAIAFASSSGQLHPVIGLWPVRLANDLEDALNSGLRKVLHWSDRHGTVAVEFEMLSSNGRTFDPFFNANTPEEFDEAQDIHASLNE